MLKRFLTTLNTKAGRDTVLTFLTEGLSMLGMVLVFRLAKDRGDVDFDRYVIVRRTVAFAFPVVLLGTMVGLTRFIAMTTDVAVQRRYLLGALTWVIPLGTLLCLACALMPGPLAWICFGSYEEAPLMLPLGLMTFGIALHGVAYGFLRGRGHVLHANAIQFFALAIAPCIAFALVDDLANVLWFTGACWWLVAAASCAPALLRSTSTGARRERSEIMRYGLPRVPGDVALGALLTLPVYVVVRTFGRDLGAEYAFACTLLNLAAAAFSPVALLLLPAISARLSSGQFGDLGQSLKRMMTIVTIASVALVAGFELLATPVLRIYLGEGGEDLVATSRLVFAAALPFAFFNGMRSVLDAYYQTPRNGVNLLMALGILLVGSWLHLLVATPWFTMGIVLLVALGWLGWATWRDLQHVRTEIDRIKARGADAMHVLVVIPESENGVVYSDPKGQANAFVELGADVSMFHLENRTSLYRLLNARRRLHRVLRTERPDVVHVYYGSVAALWTVLSSPLPVVVTFMGDDLDRSDVPGFVRSRLGGFFSQIAAFFAAGIICADERVRDNLWWRGAEARVLSLRDRDHAREALAHLRRVAFHGAQESRTT
ncbi:MAG: glycosyltransferase [Flavobacteriales bacterium]